jgi:hypothetical protein
MNEFPQHNTGVLIGQRATDFMAGALSYEVRNPKGDWRDYLPKYEKQRDPLETMACVTFSNLSGCEVQTIHQTGAEVNYSDRFTAKMSGTTKDGNYQWAVADSIRHHGVVLEEVYPHIQTSDWNTYYASIPQHIINGAIKLEYQYEFLPIRQTALDKETLAYHLKHAPLQVIVPAPYPNHAVLAVHIEGDTVWYLDTYPMFLKKMHYSKITSALKGVLTIKKNNMFLANDKGTVYVITGNKDKRKIGLADLLSLGLFGDEPQIPMDTSGIAQYNVIKDGKTITK